MLVMRRRAGERFLIGDEIEIEVLEIAGTRVKLGITAPPSVVIVRREVQITQDENQSAASSVDPAAIHSVLASLPRSTPAGKPTCQNFDNQAITEVNHT